MNHVRERSGPARSGPAGRTALKVVATTAAASLAVFGGVTAAHAAPGDQSAATGTFLGGSILDLIDLSSIVNVEGASATNDGTVEPDVTDFNTLDLTALGLVNVDIGGGIQIPIDFADIGVLGQYASALPDGSSVGASGLIGADGAVGTGVTPAPGVVPGPLHVNLSNAVQAIAGSVAAGLVDELATVDLTVGAVGANATQAAPAPATGDYTIASGQLVVGSETVAGLTGAVDTGVLALQGTVDDLQALLDAALDDALSSLGIVTASLDVDTTSLTDAVSGLLTGTLTDPAYPGVSIDLSTGSIIVDLGAIQPLNGLGVGEEILDGDTIQAIQDAVFALLNGLTSEIDAALTSAIDGLAVTGGASIDITFPVPVTIPVLTVDTTVGALLDGDTSGIELFDGITLPDGLEGLVALLAEPLDGLIGQVTDLTESLLVPVNDLLLPAIDEVLPLVVSLTANNQSTDGAGVFTETALRLSILPTIDGVTIDLASATVGPNALDPNIDVTITDPFDGQEFVVPGATDTQTVTVAGEGQPGANVTVSIPGQADQSSPVDATDGTWSVEFADLPVGDYTATATQDVDETTAFVDFAVVEAEDVQITEPADGDVISVPNPDSVTNVTIGGTGEPGYEVTVVVDGQTLTDEVGVDGTWSVVAEDLPIGEYDAEATQEDGSSANVSFEIAEAADVAITAPEDGDEFVVDGSTDTQTVTVEGTGDPGADITVVVTGQDPQTVSVDGDGNWSAVFEDLPVGGYTATATQDSDASSDTVDFTIVAATDVVITSPQEGELLLVDEPGDLRDVVVAGTGQAGAEVTVEIPGEDPQVTDVDEDGNWSVLFEDLGEGDYTATATQDDDSTDSVNFSIAAAEDVVITAPEPDEVFWVPGAEDVTDVTVTGTSQPDALVTVTVTGVGTQVVPSDEDGNWEAEFLDVPVGDYTAVATQDADDSTDSVDFSVEEYADVAITSPEDGAVLLVPNETDTRDVEVTGTGAPGAEITVSGEGLETQTTTVDEDGTWSVVIPDVPEGEHTITADQDVDESSTSVEISVEAADDVVITSPTDGQQITSDASGSNTVDVTGIGQPGATITVTLDGDAEMTATVGEDGTWTTTFLGVQIGDHTATAVQDVDESTSTVGFAIVAGPDTSQARATVTQTRIVRGPGATQTVLVTGMQPGESVSGTVHSTPFDLPAVTADASGSARMTFAVGSDFELGAHRVDVRGSITGEIPDERETTSFTVVAATAAGGGAGGGLAATGSSADMFGFVGAGVLFLIAGAVVAMLRRRRTAD